MDRKGWNPMRIVIQGKNKEQRIEQLQAPGCKLKAFKSIATHFPLFGGFPQHSEAITFPPTFSVDYIHHSLVSNGSNCSVHLTHTVLWCKPFVLLVLNNPKPKELLALYGTTGILLETWCHETNKLDQISHSEFNSIHIATFSDWIV